MALCYSGTSSQKVRRNDGMIYNEMLKADKHCEVYVTHLNKLSRMILKYGKNVTGTPEYEQCNTMCWQAFEAYNNALTAVCLFTQELMDSESEGIYAILAEDT